MIVSVLVPDQNYTYAAEFSIALFELLYKKINKIDTIKEKCKISKHSRF